MKKIFTLIVALVATLSAMAQNHGAMNFVGTSTFYVVDMQETTTTQERLLQAIKYHKQNSLEF